ncbi:purine and uridine phosphorylase [Zopfia rhizophila CBS 207.26]|uniref:Purine and uridine phosphorylase n=1 Tax=Zopfia rhizophila CBS 207.26 TaxID=1314779 RepID=A0A6A6DFY3_9PEZI|nr:purine and uridine phosphorylase [Zopfia rhizophila CBS 207.26]
MTTPLQYSSNCDLYTFGCISDHNVVLACFLAGQTGPQSAATAAARMISKFTSICFGLMVGIGGGVPSAGLDIGLGDVVISQLFLQHEGVLNAPPVVLLSAVSKLRALHHQGQNNLPTYLSTFNPLETFSRNTAGSNVLFNATYNRIGEATCEQYSKEMEVVVYYGIIASGNQVVKDGVTRDRISAELGGVMCFEMEAARLMNNFPCLVIQAATAAAYVKEILSIVPAAIDEADYG